MSQSLPNPDSMSPEWSDVLRAGVEAQRLVPGSVVVGGTAAALYAHHRISLDTDHLLPDLAQRFDEIRQVLDLAPRWKTARVHVPKLILGSLDGIPVGYRQMLRTTPLATSEIETPTGKLVVPTLDELLGMKAYLAYSRNATRDFLDFAALTSCCDDQAVLTTLLKSDERYGELQSDSVALEIAKALAESRPYDLDSTKLREYKSVQAPWHDWSHVEAICQRWGLRLADSLLRN